MISVTAQWNPKQALLKELLSKPAQFNDAIQLCLEMHALVHTSEMSGSQNRSLEDEVWDGLEETAFRTMPTAKDVTIAWNLWHLTRIEDLTANILIANGQQVLNDEWLKKMNVTVRDTGNAMSDEEIIALSLAMDMKAMRDYRIAVGRRTREILKALQPNDLKRKFTAVQLQRIMDEGGLLEVEGSKWLLDFWGKKTVAGILQMPITRHQVVHINDSMKLKAKCGKRR
ncbi:MAG TPA: DinB family protein [Bacillota bacterium]|jgi:hypothetical protein|nr:DinB family protein [Bacillota bacterium]